MPRANFRATEEERVYYADMVRALMAVRRLSQAEVGEIVGCSRFALMKRMAGEVPLTLEAFYAMRWAYRELELPAVMPLTAGIEPFTHADFRQRNTEPRRANETETL